MASFGFDDLLSIPTMGAYTAQKQMGGVDLSGGNSVGDTLGSYQNLGNNNFNAPPPAQYSSPDNQVTPGQALGHMGDNAQDLGMSRSGMDYAMGQMGADRGPQAWGNQDLANQEANARADQNAAVGLAAQQATGMTPSVADFQMQKGLNDALANQSAIQGSARGGAALAMAQGNGAGNAANMEQNAFTGAGQLRAQEINNGIGNLIGATNQQRQGDQGLMGQGNQMSQFNAGLNDQYALGMGGLGVQYGGLSNQLGQTNQGYFNSGVNIGQGNQQMQGQTNQLNSNNSNAYYDRAAGISQANAQNKKDNTNALISMGGKLVGMGGSAINPAGGG